jgi:amidohydrolase
MKPSLYEQALQLTDDLRDWRRALHAHPELSGHEEWTASFVAQRLREMGWSPAERVGQTWGLTADFRVAGAPFVALRADMDGLPISEETGVDYASTNPGVMHACGHDAHIAMLLGAARLLQLYRPHLKRSVRLIFQPHEELYPGGAPAMIAAGALTEVEAIFGIHAWANLNTGQLGTRVGPFMAAVNSFKIVIRGKGGHAAMPDQCIDPVVAAAHVVVALQTVVSRSIAMAEPAVVSVTQFQAGSGDNVIPNDATLCGTIRTFDEEIRQRTCDRVRELAGGVARAHRAAADIEICPGYPAQVNDQATTQRALEAALMVGIKQDSLITLAPQGVGEDFAYYCQNVPGAFVFLGAANEAKSCPYPHHHPRFNVDEDVLPRGAALHAQFALGFAKP